jgi:hypothetical protein
VNNENRVRKRDDNSAFDNILYSVNQLNEHFSTPESSNCVIPMASDVVNRRTSPDELIRAIGKIKSNAFVFY